MVNDGSLDDTAKIARDAGAMVIDLPYNMGIGSAVQTGFILAKERQYDAVLRLDGDGQHRPKEVKNLLAPILEDRADVVVGSRFLSGAGFRSTIPRRMGIGLFSFLLALTTGKKATDPTSGFQVMNNRAINFFVKEYPPEYPEVEARILAHKAGLRVEEVPTVMVERTGVESSINFYNSVYFVLEVFISTIVSAFRKF